MPLDVTLNPLSGVLARPPQRPLPPQRPAVRFGEDSFQKNADDEYETRTAPVPTPLDSTPVDGTDIIVFDLETTGLRPRKPDPKNPDEPLDDVTEISAMRFRNGVKVDEFYALVKPNRPIPPEIEQKTGITTERAQRDGIDIATALQRFSDFIGPKPVPLVGHNARSFDTWFLRGVAERYGLSHLRDRFNYEHVADTLQMAKKRFPNVRPRKKPDPANPPTPGQPENLQLSTVAAHYGISNPGAHQARFDVETAAKLFYKLVEDIRKQGTPLKTFGELFQYQFFPHKVKKQPPAA